MSTSSLKILCRYQYDPLDRLTGVGLLERASTQRFYQQDHLTTELGEQTQRTIIRHEAQPLAQLRIATGGTETTLLATDQADSLLQAVGGTNPQQLAYTAYGHHPEESGLSRLLGFNGECPEEITGHYLLGQGTRAFNPILMRFNSPDELSPFGEGGINSYAYCEGDPINFRDPTGTVGRSIAGLVSKSSKTLHATRKTSSSIARTVSPPLRTVDPTATTIAQSAHSSRHSAIDLPSGTTQSTPSSSSNSSTSNSKYVSFTHELPITQRTRGWNVKDQKLFDDAVRYDTFKKENPGFVPIASRKQNAGWSHHHNEINKLGPNSEETTHLKKAKLKKTEWEMKIKQLNIRNQDALKQSK